jgi:hypothetical protein
VIDECQERGETDWENRLLTYIVDKRYAQLRDTVLISNQTKDQFCKSMGSSIISRMQETGGSLNAHGSRFGEENVNNGKERKSCHANRKVGKQSR